MIFLVIRPKPDIAVVSDTRLLQATFQTVGVLEFIESKTSFCSSLLKLSHFRVSTEMILVAIVIFRPFLFPNQDVEPVVAFDRAKDHLLAFRDRSHVVDIAVAVPRRFICDEFAEVNVPSVEVLVNGVGLGWYHHKTPSLRQAGFAPAADCQNLESLVNMVPRAVPTRVLAKHEINIYLSIKSTPFSPFFNLGQILTNPTPHEQLITAVAVFGASLLAIVFTA
jgi:hypothetical protein